MKELLYDILNSFCPNNVYLQNSLNSDEKFPQKFITYFVQSTDDISHFDNDVNAVEWDLFVVFYSDNPTEVNSIPAQIRSALKAAGFIPQGKGYDIYSGEITHSGWAMNFKFRENINENIISI